MPVLVIAVVAFIIFNIMMVMFVAAVVSEQRQDKRVQKASGKSVEPKAAPAQR